MPRKQRTPKVRIEGISDAALWNLSDGLMGEPSEESDLYGLFIDDEALRSLWSDNGAAILEEWIQHCPGSRPRSWWRFSAPEQRQRLGGTGTPSHEVLSYAPRFEKGIPTIWVDAFDEAYYNGRARDVNGKPIGTQYAPGDFAGRAIDPDDPPLYESQASYLKRLGLLLPGEERRLRPLAFEPEAVIPEKGTIQ